jgi:hypothetical protein
MELEVSDDPEFKSNLKKLRIGPTEPPLKQVLGKIALPVNPKATAWYWRVRTLNLHPSVTKSEKFWIQSKKEASQLQLFKPPALPPPPSQLYAPEIKALKNHSRKLSK